MAENGWKNATDKVLAAAERGMKKAVIAFEADTKALTHEKTGHLRRSWTHDVVKTGDDVVGKVGTNVSYAKYEDEYHGNISTALNDNYDKYMKKPILIVDMNGNRYEISGNFTSEFLAAMSRVANKYLEYQKVLQSNNPDPAIYGELFDLMKDWCLMLINMNTSGETYTMANINAGFNDYDVLVAVFAFINDRIKTTNIKLDNDQKG